MAATRFDTRQGCCCPSSMASSSGRGSSTLGELAFTMEPHCAIGFHGAFASMSLPAMQRRWPGISVLAWLGRKKVPVDTKFMQWLDAAKSGEQPPSAATKSAPEPRAPSHPEVWYRERCVFCASCRESINDSTREKSGIRCQGCRRWFHHRCRKRLPALPTQSPEEQQRQGQQSGSYFHCGECRQQYHVLANAAAKGDAVIGNGRSLRLLELAAVKKELEGRTANGSLPTDAHIRRAWSAAADSSNGGSVDSVNGTGSRTSAGTTGAAAASSSAGTPSHSQGDAYGAEASSAQQAASADALQPLQSARPHRPPSGLETFLAVTELLNRGPYEEPAEDLVEDAFGLALRHNGQLVCAATFNLHAPDHARVQSMVTDPSSRRQGHAAALLGELQSLLSSAGIQELVVVLDEGVPEDVKAAQRLLRCKCGFSDVSPQQLVQWRKELPEYHKQLLGNATLLVKPLQ